LIDIFIKAEQHTVHDLFKVAHTVSFEKFLPCDVLKGHSHRFSQFFFILYNA
jgi:hypothetical protein